MLARIGYYKAALILTSVIVLAEFIFMGFLFLRGSPVEQASLVRTAITLAIPIGLWLISNITRYLAAAWYAAITVAIVHEAFINESIDNKFSTYWVFALAAMTVAAVWLLVFSKGFAEEFRALRATRPAWKATLGRSATVILVVAAVATTAPDIYRAFSK